jgi:hypothetical protein
LAERADQSKSNILLDPELNPILNPLLSAHMGRWAEVYFTSPPEKREQAVAELVRELSRDSGAPPAEKKPLETEAPVRRDLSEPIFGGPSAFHPERWEQEQALGAPRQVSELAEIPITVCHLCGHLNAPGQRFCGMCGVALMVQNARDHAIPVPESLPPSEAIDTDTAEDLDPENGLHLDAPQRDEAQRTQAIRPQEVNENAPEPESRATASAAERVAPERSILSYETDSARRNYKAYMGVAALLLLALLVYATWRANLPGAGGRSDSAPALLPGTSPKPVAGAPAPATGFPAKTGEDPASGLPKDAGIADKAGISRQTEKESSAASARPVIAPVATSATAASGSTGSEELAAAQKYLKSGPDGAAPAVELLWKAVAKQNLAATLLLSDLYLKGEGVEKSCDQARLLLGAAARKGAPAAAQKLTTLPDYGCQ